MEIRILIRNLGINCNYLAQNYKTFQVLYSHDWYHELPDFLLLLMFYECQCNMESEAWKE